MVLLTLIAPAVLSIIITLLYATEGYLASGESFDLEKFAATITVQIMSLVAVVLACYGIDEASAPAIIALLPSLVTICVTKVISWYRKRKDF